MAFRGLFIKSQAVGGAQPDAETEDGRSTHPSGPFEKKPVSSVRVARTFPSEPKRMTMRATRIPRHSSGWAALLKHLKEEPALRTLDIGPTSTNNINFLTGMGHSVYMADIVQEALDGEWLLPPTEDGEAHRFDTESFFEHNLNFGERQFDVVLLWTTIDYLPEGLIRPLIERFHSSMVPGGQLLAFFHSKSAGPDTTFCRYHLVDSNEIDTQQGGQYSVNRVYTNREIERLFSAFSGCKFFLAKDNVYEVIVTR